MTVALDRRAEPAARATRVVCIAALITIWASACARTPATVVAGGDVERGRQTMSAMGCTACHDIAGVPGVRGEVGPPLAGVRSRSIIGGALPNTPDNMMLWIENPPSIAPNTAMPNLGVTPEEARDMVAYLYSLK